MKIRNIWNHHLLTYEIFPYTANFPAFCWCPMTPPLRQKTKKSCDRNKLQPNCFGTTVFLLKVSVFFLRWKQKFSTLSMWVHAWYLFRVEIRIRWFSPCSRLKHGWTEFIQLPNQHLIFVFERSYRAWTPKTSKELNEIPTYHGNPKPSFLGVISHILGV